MNVEYFGYLLEINRFHSISSAAKALNISQARLSSIVKAVEDEVNYSIFQRTPQGVELTPVGEQFMALAWDIHIKHEALMSLKIRGINETPSISLFLPPSVALRLSLPLTRRFRQFALPGTLEFREGTSESIIKSILNNESNIGIAYLSDEELLNFEQRIDSNMLCAEYLSKEQLYLLVSKEHPLAAQDFADMQMFYHAQIASPKATPEDLRLRVMSMEVDYSGSCVNIDAMYQLISEEGMVGFVPGLLNSPDSAIDPSGFCFLPLVNTNFKNQFHLVLFTFKGRTLRHQEKILLQCIRDYFRTTEDAADRQEIGGDLL